MPYATAQRTENKPTRNPQARQPYEASLEQLATAVQLPAGPDYGRLKFDPVWDNLRADPKFQEIMTRATQPPNWN